MTRVYPDWQAARWPNFTPEEMACKGTGQLVVVPEFMDALQALRWTWQQPMTITSGYRSPDYNAKVSRTRSRYGPHTLGLAVDIALQGAPAFALVQVAMHMAGWRGIGIGKTFIHLDRVILDPEIPRPRIWGYGE